MKKIAFLGISTIVLLTVSIYMNVNTNSFTELHFKNIEALAQGEEAPRSFGAWTPVAGQPETFIRMDNIGGHCYNVYRSKHIFVCPTGTDQDVCGSNKQSEIKRPCDC